MVAKMAALRAMLLAPLLGRAINADDAPVKQLANKFAAKSINFKRDDVFNLGVGVATSLEEMYRAIPDSAPEPTNENLGTNCVLDLSILQ